jgi:hypothetical protein
MVVKRRGATPPRPRSFYPRFSSTQPRQRPLTYDWYPMTGLYDARDKLGKPQASPLVFSSSITCCLCPADANRGTGSYGLLLPRVSYVVGGKSAIGCCGKHAVRLTVVVQQASFRERLLFGGSQV